jgi:hypothetical protein
MEQNTNIRASFQDGSLESGKLPSIDFDGIISNEVEVLRGAIDRYQDIKDKPNQPLIDAQAEVVRLTRELNEAQVKLKGIEAQGSYLQQFEARVVAAERTLQTMVDRYKSRVVESIVVDWFGHSLAWNKLSQERRSDIELHRRVTDLLKFRISVSSPSLFDANKVSAAAKAAGERLKQLAINQAINEGKVGPDLARVKADAERAASNLEHDLLLRARNSEQQLESQLIRRADNAGQLLCDLVAHIQADKSAGDK